MLWSIVVDGLVCKLTGMGFDEIENAEDVVIVISGKPEKVDANSSPTSYPMVQRQRSGSEPHRKRYIIVPFTSKTKGNLDQRLKWIRHLSYIKNESLPSLQICRQLLEKVWGLKSNMT